MPRPERQPFSTHMSGPRTPAEVQIARRERKERRERLSEVELERMPGQDALISYLQRRGRGSDCTDELHCYPERYESKLMDDMYAARAANHEESLREIREVIWTGSWRLHKTHDPMTAARLVEDLRDKVDREQSVLEATHPQDAKDMQETLDELSAVSEVLRDLKTGDTLEPATQTIEDRYASTLRRAEAEHSLPRVREQAKKELSGLRVVRDELYYSLLFPNWARTRNAATRKTFKRGA